MTATKARIVCSACSGRGVVPHEKRKIGPADMKVNDPLDFQFEELCAKCGGSGKVAGEAPVNG